MEQKEFPFSILKLTFNFKIVRQLEITAKEALEIIEPIPAEKFTTSVFNDEEGRCCVLGHLHRVKVKGGSYDWPSFDAVFTISKFRGKTERFLNEKHNIDANIATVNNDAEVNGYIEPEIKDRVVHLLKDMIEAGY